MTKPSCLQRFRPLLAILFLSLTAASLTAQEQRWLLIFDTSSPMKKRLPALDMEVTKLFMASAGDHIRPGDSVGVWAFGNNQLHAGQLPLITYDPSEAANITSNVLKYVHSQQFKGDTSFDPLQPSLGSVVQNCERLTIIIFADGVGQLEGTPFDYAINQDMVASIDERKKTKQPVVIIIRSQKGKYVGGTANFPPAPSSVPQFPPLPPPPKPAPVVESQPVVKPVPAIPDLIINGTTTSTNPDSIAAYVSKPKPVVTAPPPPPAPAPAPVVTAPVAPAPTAPAPAPMASAPAPVAPAPVVQAPVAPKPAPAPAPAQPEAQSTLTPVTHAPAPAEAPAAAPANSASTPSTAAPAAVAAAPAAVQGTDFSTKILLVVGGVFFGMALLLVIFFLTRRKAPQSSLITSIMTDDPKRPK